MCIKALLGKEKDKVINSVNSSTDNDKLHFLSTMLSSVGDPTEATNSIANLSQSQDKQEYENNMQEVMAVVDDKVGKLRIKLAQRDKKN